MINSDETSDFEVSEQTSDESAANESSKEESRFCCDVSGCSKKFTKNRNLQNHIRLHQGEVIIIFFNTVILLIFDSASIRM